MNARSKIFVDPDPGIWIPRKTCKRKVESAEHVAAAQCKDPHERRISTSGTALDSLNPSVRPRVRCFFHTISLGSQTTRDTSCMPATWKRRDLLGNHCWACPTSAAPQAVRRKMCKLVVLGLEIGGQIADIRHLAASKAHIHPRPAKPDRTSKTHLSLLSPRCFRGTAVSPESTAADNTRCTSHCCGLVIKDTRCPTHSKSACPQ